MVSNGVTTGQYRYDHQGRRIQKTEGSTTTNYLYDGQNLYAEYPGTSWATPAAQYVQAGLDHPLARLTGQVNLPTATAAYYHQDGLGSVLAMTNATKTITATQRFDAFGSKIGGANSIPQYGYTGREPDVSGLIYYRARYYDPNQTRFTQRDPLGYTDGVNPYLYVHNNPINFNDPKGLLMAKVSNAVTPSISYFTSGQFSQTLGDTTLAFGGAVQNNPTIGLTGTVPILAVPAAPQMLALGFVASGEMPLGVTKGVVKPGEFSISDWSGYPSSVPKPQGPFKLLEGTEYDAARKAANQANNQIRVDNNLRGQPVDVHEIKPVKFDGSPTDPANKVILDRDLHRQQVTPWWNQLLKDLVG
ncbi:RHS repeat-associated core domain-containing protein [Methylomonas methanica]|uniref:RHS repeat-associated core domain-containing protein n=1 Tax=Methylomonas methanica TaxID=421 RepID=UPI001EE63707|nr:RHS repeat-associated core domain-containing protein [Methylomonas methanica]